MINIQEISERINSFDFYYDYSENGSVWSKGNRNEKEIKKELDELTHAQMVTLKGLITVEEQHLNFKFRKYFEGHEPEPEPVQLKSAHAIKLSKIMSNAWAMFRDGIFVRFCDALKAAWRRSKLVSTLRHGIAYFTYKKASGEERKAIGTLRNGNFLYEPKGATTTTAPHIIKYFDLEKRAWRSCRVDRLTAA